MQVNLVDAEHGRAIFDTLSAKGEVWMPLAKTFWSELSALFTDRFGVPWEINVVRAEDA